MKTIYLSLGTNIGKKKENLKNAILYLKEKVKIKKISYIYETEPVGVKNQPFFYNICIKGYTVLSPQDLLKFVKNIEKKMGRKKIQRWGPRIIDIDILFYGNIIVKYRDLIIPHAEILNRKFVLKPLCDIGKDFIHPVYKKKIKTLYKEKNFLEKVKKIGALKI